MNIESILPNLSLYLYNTVECNANYTPIIHNQFLLDVITILTDLSISNLEFNLLNANNYFTNLIFTKHDFQIAANKVSRDSILKFIRKTILATNEYGVFSEFFDIKSNTLQVKYDPFTGTAIYGLHLTLNQDTLKNPQEFLTQISVLYPEIKHIANPKPVLPYLLSQHIINDINDHIPPTLSIPNNYIAKITYELEKIIQNKFQEDTKESLISILEYAAHHIKSKSLNLLTRLERRSNC